MLAAILLAVLLASCSLGRPSVALTVNGVVVAGAAAGSYYNNRCSTNVGHGIPSPDAATVPATASGSGLDLEVGTGSVKAISATIFAGDTPTSEPVMVAFPKDSRRALVPGLLPGPYYLSIRVEWEGLFDAGAETYAFRIILRAP